MNMHNNPMLSSKSEDWATPQDLFDRLNAEFKFDLDAAASKDNAKVSNYIYKELDSLKANWNQYTSVYCNPPYGRGIGKWVEKAYITSLQGTTVVMLLPSRTDTKWFHGFCLWGEVRFIKGRLKFNNHKNPAPFPSMVVIFRGSK